MFWNTPTSKKVSLYFSFFSFLSLISLLLSINISYFLMWYNEQKKESFYDMNMSYSEFTKDGMNQSNIASFKDYILQKDVLILPNVWEPICSSSLTSKTKEDIESLQKKWLYRFEDKIYIVYSQTYEEIGEVKVFFDTTSYIKSQIFIIKISTVFILFFVILNYFIWEFIVKISLRNLEKIKKYSSQLNLESHFSPLILEWCQNDEIVIVANTLNTSLEKIIEQNDTLKQFITDVSHEFKTPLMEISSKINLFQKKYEKWLLEKEDFPELFEQNTRMVVRLNALLEMLFTLTRIEQNQIHLHKTSLNLREYFEEKRTSKNIKNFEIIWEKTLKVDLASFDIICENLLNNSIKFGWENNTITVTLTQNSFSIKDTGCGMSEENLEKIFQKFFRENTDLEWFGIGLFLVKRLLTLYNWGIEVKSEKNIGSEFIIFFAKHES